MAFRVKFTARAKRDLNNILAWLIEHDAGDAGISWFQGMKDAIGGLSKLPNRCPLAPESSTFDFEVRQLLYGRKPHGYRILFTIKSSDVLILHVRHGRRDYLPH